MYLISTDIQAYLAQHERGAAAFSHLRQRGRRQEHADRSPAARHGLIFEDQLAALERDSRRCGTTGSEVDLALLTDGLQAEREQGITIDVAPIAISPPPGASSSSPTRRATSSTRATW
jgi:hypothetical protein